MTPDVTRLWVLTLLGCHADARRAHGACSGREPYESAYRRLSGAPARIELSRAEGDPEWLAKMALNVANYRNCTRCLGGDFFAADLEGETRCDPAMAVSPTQCTKWYSSATFCVPRVYSKASLQEVAVDTLQRHKIITADEVAVLRNDQLAMPSREFDERHFFVEYRDGLRRFGIHMLGDWSSFDLSFAILGLNGCGTSELAFSLHHHPDVEMLFEFGREQTMYLDNHLLVSQTRLPFHLPTALAVRNWNQFTTKSIRPQAEQHRARLRGMKSPFYIYRDLALARLRHVPGLRAIVLIGDPAVRYERMYLKTVGRCLISKDSYMIPPLTSCFKGNCGPKCEIGVPESAWVALVLNASEYQIAQRVRHAEAELGRNRLFLADRGALGKGAAFYNTVAAFLGVRPFSSFAFRERAKINEASLVVTKNASLRVRMGTQEIRQTVFAAGPQAAEVHEAAMVALRRRFARERRELRELFAVLPPRLPKSDWPAWLLQP